MMLVNTNSTGIFDTANQFCMSCLPAYEPVLATGTISKCDLIVIDASTNCPTPKSTDLKQLNTCMDCVWSFNNKTIVTSASNSTVPDCIASTTELKNCFAGYLDGSTKKCSICKPGYEVDSADGQCY